MTVKRKTAIRNGPVGSTGATAPAVVGGAAGAAGVRSARSVAARVAQRKSEPVHDRKSAAVVSRAAPVAAVSAESSRAVMPVSADGGRDAPGLAGEVPAAGAPVAVGAIDPWFSDLAVILGEGGYLSHETALHLLGHRAAPPPVLTVVCGTRRRNRQLGDRELVFIYHKAGRLGPVQELHAGPVVLTTSTLEKTLVDFLLDPDHAPTLRELTDLFATLPYDPEQLLSLAVETSDTVTKRALCLVTLAGRLALPTAMIARLTRTPVVLDPRCRDDCSLWESRLYLRVPPWLAEWLPPLPPAGVDAATRDWMCLRRYPPFVRHLLRHARLPLRFPPDGVAPAGGGRSGDDAMPPASGPAAGRRGGSVPAVAIPAAAADPGDGLRQFVADFAAAHVERELDTDGLVALFSEHFPPPRAPTGPAVFPAAIHAWLRGHPERWPALASRLLGWIRAHLQAGQLDRLAVAVRLAFIAGIGPETVEVLYRHGLYLFDAGHHQLLRESIETLENTLQEIPHYLYVVLHRVHLAAGEAEKARVVLERAIARFEAGGDPLAVGDLHHALGTLLVHMRRPDEALPALYVARAAFENSRDPARQGMVMGAIGNLQFGLGQLREARRSYLRSLAAFHQTPNPRPRASLLANLGLVDSAAGRLRQAERNLARAVALYGRHNMRFQQANGLLQLGINRLLQAHLTKALQAFQASYELKRAIGSEADTGETVAFIAWTHGMLGSHATAQAWWKKIRDDRLDENRPRLGLQALLLKGMYDIMLGQPKHAIGRFESSLRKLDELRATDRERSLAMSYLGLAQCVAGLPEGVATLLRVEEMLGPEGELSHWRVACMLGAFCDDPAVRARCRDGMSHYLDCHAWDPLWAYYAVRLYATGEPLASRFLRDHLSRTPPTTLSLLRQSVPGFKRLQQQLRTEGTRAAQFVTLVRDGNAQTIHLDEYARWAATIRTAPRLVFDGRTGMLRFGASSVGIRPGSLPHQVLVQLLTAHPDAVEQPALYRTVWGTSFDPECDECAFKSTIQRLRRRLAAVHRGLRLRQGVSGKGRRLLRLVIPGPWEAVF